MARLDAEAEVSRQPRGWRRLSPPEVVDYLRSLLTMWTDAGPQDRRALATALFAKVDESGCQKVEYELTSEAIELALSRARPAILEVGVQSRSARRAACPRGAPQVALQVRAVDRHPRMSAASAVSSVAAMAPSGSREDSTSASSWAGSSTYRTGTDVSPRSSASSTRRWPSTTSPDSLKAKSTSAGCHPGDGSGVAGARRCPDGKTRASSHYPAGRAVDGATGARVRRQRDTGLLRRLRLRASSRRRRP